MPIAVNDSLAWLVACRCTLLVLCVCSCTWSTDWYAAAGGSSTNGTYAEPWSVEYAVGKVANPQLQPGDTVIFKNGGYVCTERNTVYSTGDVLELHISGTPGAKITYRPEHVWGFSFDGGLLLTATVSNVVIRNFRMFYSPTATTRNRTADYTYPAGIQVFGEGVDILHNLIENSGHPGIASWKTTRGKYIAGNIIRFIGVNDFTGGYNGGARGSGMYLQNADNSATALIEGNISYFNHTTGLKAYGNTDIWGFRFVHQICVENNEAGIFYHQDNYGSQGVEYVDNYIWNGRPGIRIGYPLGNGGHQNAVVTNNYVVDNYRPFDVVDGWSNMTVTGNTAVQLSSGSASLWRLEVLGELSGDVTSHHMSGNSYFTNAGGNAFLIREAPTNLAGWKTGTGQDANAAYSAGVPSTLRTFAFRPSTDPDFVHVAVFNWSGVATASVNLSAYFTTGDIVSIYDAQAIPRAYSAIVYGGGNVSLDLTRTDIAPMSGSFANRTWQGFDTRFRAFVIHRETVMPVGPTIITQPSDQTVASSATATFIVVASGTPEPNFQWQRAAPSTVIFGDIAGATSATYSALATSGMNGNHYRCVVSNSAGVGTSVAATLTVPSSGGGSNESAGASGGAGNCGFGFGSLLMLCGLLWRLRSSRA